MEPFSAAALAALILASRSGAEEIGKEAGRSTWAGLARLRSLVSRKFEGDAHAQRVLLRAEQEPQDPQAVAALQQALELCAKADSTFAARLQRLADDARRRPEYQPGSQFLSNYGLVGKVTIFNAPVTVEEGGFTIN